jgi:uncharacterized membrane protein YuzA (DUF378 family)
MILAYFDVIVCKLILVMLILCTLNFVFVGVLRVFIEVGLTLAVDTYPEQFAAVIVGSTRCDCIFDHFESLVDSSECIKI